MNSFHGRTIATLTATGQDTFHHYFGPFNEGFVYTPAGDVEALTKLVNKSTCAIMLELVQGEGGVVPLDQEYVRAVRALCDEKDLVLIVDEVQTGVGRHRHLPGLRAVQPPARHRHPGQGPGRRACPSARC